VHAHPHQGEAVLGADLVHDTQGQPDRGRRVAGPEHQRIPDGLDLLGLVLGEQLAHSRREPADQVGGVLVPVGLGQRGEAREVREQERLRCQLGPLCHPALQALSDERGHGMVIVPCSGRRRSSGQPVALPGTWVA
jgi:hypothetical protein